MSKEINYWGAPKVKVRKGHECVDDPCRRWHHYYAPIYEIDTRWGRKLDGIIKQGTK